MRACPTRWALRDGAKPAKQKQILGPRRRPVQRCRRLRCRVHFIRQHCRKNPSNPEPSLTRCARGRSRWLRRFSRPSSGTRCRAPQVCPTIRAPGCRCTATSVSWRRLTRYARGRHPCTCGRACRPWHLYRSKPDPPPLSPHEAATSARPAMHFDDPAPLMPRTARPAPLAPVAQPSARRFLPSQGASSANAANGDDSTEVHIHIGRIDVTAVQEAPPPRRRAAAAPPPMSLEGYLAQRGRS